jgi:hypothetical protein
VPDDGLDAEKLGVLRRWGVGLQTDPRGEVAAAGRAITLLIDEIERLHVLVWDRRLFPDSPLAPIAPTAYAPEPEEAEAEAQPPRPSPWGSLRGRLRRPTRQTRPQPDPQADPPPEADLPDSLQQAAEPERDEGASDASGSPLAE